MMKSKTEQTINAYNKNAANYTSKFENFPTYKRKISEFHQKHIPKSATILDLGCGPGNNVQTILSLDDSCHFTGVDLSTSFVEIARQKLPHCTFINKDIRQLDFRSKFDIVIASFCIVHLTDEETTDFINRISNFLTRNGKLYLSFMQGEKSGFESTSFSKDEIFFNYYSVEFITELLEKSGLEILEISKENYLETDGSITTDIFVFANKSH